MIHTIEANNLQDLFYNVLYRVIREGKEVTVRGLKTKELHPCMMCLNHPKNRTLLYPKRGNNPIATVAETLWVLSGTNNLTFLKKFLPRCTDFSDDGETWRAGYGPRIFNHNGVSNYGYACVNQVYFVIKQLKKDKYSRQAVITIWDPAKDATIESTKDYPCSNWLHFMIRDDKLDLTLTMRSNDAIWGFSSINVYEFTVLQELIAKELGIEVGKYFHLSDSLHMYEFLGKKNNFEASQEMVDSWIELPKLPEFEFGQTKRKFSFTKYRKEVQHLIELHTTDTNKSKKKIKYTFDFNDLNLLDKVFAFYGTNDIYLLNSIKRMPFSDLKVAMMYWYRKNINKLIDSPDLIKVCISDCR